MDNTTPAPRVVDAGRGTAWWAGGWRLFASNPLTWIGIIIVYGLISLVLGLIPIIGSIGQALLTPVFVGGLMLGCRSIERDGSLRLAHLFEGFQGNHFVPLMIIGAVNLGLFLAILVVTTMGIFSTVGLTTLMQPDADPADAIAAAMAGVPVSAFLMVIVVLVLVAIMAMLNWFAPALVALRGVQAWEAMQHSFRACLRNWLPFLVYGLVGLVVFVVFWGVALVAGFGIFASAFTGNSGWAAMLVALMLFGAACAAGALIVGPIMFGSAYASYVDVFASPGESLPNPAYR